MTLLLPLVAGVLTTMATAPAPTIEAVRTTNAPAIDGRLDEAAWVGTPANDAFTQKFPQEGARPTERTLMRVLYDDEAVYLGVDCQQVRSPLLPRMARRDRELETDQVVVSIDSRRDGVTAFEFVVTATGVLRDGLRFDDTEVNWDWDEAWEGRAAVSSKGWSAELRIPLRVLRFEARPIQDWGFNVSRQITARQEIAEWAYVPRTEAGVVSRYGRLTNLVGLRPAHRMELRPFLVARATRWEPGYGPRTGLAAMGSFGLDLKGHPTQSLTLLGTLLPDFGQVEADQVVLNLSTTENNHPEKRPFFLDGTEFFATPMEVLYTRRIGRAASSPARLPGETPADLPEPAPIWGAGKLVGRTGGLGLGMLSALTGPNRLAMTGPTGARTMRLADPMTSYNVLRAKHDLGHGHLGAIATATARVEDYAEYPVHPDTADLLCPGGAAPAGRRCFRDAYTAGIDGRWRSPAGDYLLSGQALASALVGGPTRLARDGTPIGSGAVAPLFDLELAKEGGAHWLWKLEGSFIGRKADLNDLGYLERQNEADLSGGLAYRTTRPWGVLLETETEVEATETRNLDDLLLRRSVELDTQVTFANFWQARVGGSRASPRFDDREIGDGAALERPGQWGIDLEIESDPRERVRVDLEASLRLLPDGGRQWDLEALLRVRVLPRLDLDLEPELSFRHGELRLVERVPGEGGVQYLCARLAARSAGAVLRATYTFTPTLTLQAYGQLFLVAKSLSDPHAFQGIGPRPMIRLTELQRVPGAFDVPDEQETVLNLNAVLRWEYRLGSTMYLVYTRAQAPETPLEVGQRSVLDPGALRRAPAAHVLLFKLSYFWS